MALYSAAEEVIATQSAKLAIQCRFVADMKLIWMLQLRFERRTGKNPYTLVEHPKYRAGYDFMLLRSALGHVPESLVHWWEDFVDADEQSALTWWLRPRSKRVARLPKREPALRVVKRAARRRALHGRGHTLRASQ